MKMHHPVTNLGSALTMPITSTLDQRDSGLGIALQAVGLESSTSAKSIQLYHVRGVAMRIGADGGEVEHVIFVPEFMYVFDLGLPARAGVAYPYDVKGLGDPAFPQRARAVHYSITGTDARALLYPNRAGELLVGVKAGTEPSQVQSDLSPHIESIDRLATDLYLAKVKRFHEPAIAETLTTKFDFVRYAHGNRIIRLIDFSPGWRIDRLV